MGSTKIGEYSIPLQGAKENENWGQQLHDDLVPLCRFLQGLKSGKEFGTDEFKFAKNSSGKFTLYEKVGAGWEPVRELGKEIASPTYRTVNANTTGDDLIIRDGENILVENITVDLSLIVDNGVKWFSVRDQQDFISPLVVAVNFDADISLTLDQSGDYVTFYNSGTHWGYCDHRTNDNYLLSPVPDGGTLNQGL